MINFVIGLCRFCCQVATLLLITAVAFRMIMNYYTGMYTSIHQLIRH